MFEYSDDMIVFETDCCTGYKKYYEWDEENSKEGSETENEQ